MATTAWRVKTGLDEVRMLILADQILLGFETRSVFEPGFAKLSHGAQLLVLGSLCLQLLIVALTLLPTVRHRLIDRGQPSLGLERTTRRVAGGVLALFAVALGVDFFVAAQRMVPAPLAGAVGLCMGLAGVVAWFGIEWVAQRLLPRPVSQETSMKPTPIDQRVSEVLTECRIALPGAQALLGFQLITALLESFERLPALAKAAHLSSTLLVGLATILLVAPAAFHRLVERGEPTERFERIASGLLLSALVPLGAGLAGELGVVFFAVTKSVRAALWSTGLGLVTFACAWVLVPLLLRRSQRQGHAPARQLREA